MNCFYPLCSPHPPCIRKEKGSFVSRFCLAWIHCCPSHLIPLCPPPTGRVRDCGTSIRILCGFAIICSLDPCCCCWDRHCRRLTISSSSFFLNVPSAYIIPLSNIHMSATLHPPCFPLSSSQTSSRCLLVVQEIEVPPGLIPQDEKHPDWKVSWVIYLLYIYNCLAPDTDRVKTKLTAVPVNL